MPRLLPLVLSIAVAANCFLPPRLLQSAWADPGTGSPTPIDLDLTSTINNLPAPKFASANPVEIMVGETTMLVDGSSTLTPAQRLAAYQVFSTGSQSIVLGANGAAIGGTMTMGANFSNYVSSVVIPAGVTAVKDFGTGSPLNLIGNLTNAGTFFAMSSNPAVTTAVINANNINNQQGALLSSILPGATIAGITNAVSNLNLQLTAIQNIINAGTISSAGNLSAIAGGTITNALPSGVTGQSPIMQALNTLSFQAPNIINQGIMTSQASNISAITSQLINSGLLQAMSGSIDIKNTLGSSLLINNTLGSIMSRDAINLSTLPGTPDIGGSYATLDVIGGDLSTEVFDVSCLKGNVTINVDQIEGYMSLEGANANIQVQSGDLNIGSLNLSGDPTFANATGDVNLGPGPGTVGSISVDIFSGGPVFSTGGGDFIVTAGADIVALNGAVGTVDASNAAGTGGKIILTAGTNGGGSVLIPTINFKTNGNDIIVSATAGGPSDGKVTIGALNTSGAGAACCIAAPSTKAPSGQDAGNISITASGLVATGSIQAFGGGGAGGLASDAPGGDGGHGGVVTIVSGALVAVAGEINTSGGGGGGLSASTTPGQTGGAGGNAGNITVTAPGGFVSAGPLLAGGGGGGAGNTQPPCCPQIFRNGGGSFGGGGGGGDVGAGGGGFYGGGGSLSFGSGGGGGFFGPGAGDNGQQNGSLGRGGDSDETPTLYHVGGNFGEGGGPTNTYVNQTGLGNAGGPGGANGVIQMNATTVTVVNPVKTFFPGAAFTNSVFADVTVFGTYNGPTVLTPNGGSTPTGTVATFNPPPPVVATPQNSPGTDFGPGTFIDPFLQRSIDLANTTLRTTFDVNTNDVTPYGWWLSNGGMTMLVNDPNKRSTTSIANNPTGKPIIGGTYGQENEETDDYNTDNLLAYLTDSGRGDGVLDGYTSESSFGELSLISKGMGPNGDNRMVVKTGAITYEVIENPDGTISFKRADSNNFESQTFKGSANYNDETGVTTVVGPDGKPMFQIDHNGNMTGNYPRLQTAGQKLDAPTFDPNGNITSMQNRNTGPGGSGVSTYTMNPDGKTYTLTTKNADGQVVNSMQVNAVPNSAGRLVPARVDDPGKPIDNATGPTFEQVVAPMLNQYEKSKGLQGK